MADVMTFPKTVDEFMEQYKVVDEDHAYSNGTAFVPIFRMKQWFEHLKEQAEEDKMVEYIERNSAIQAASIWNGDEGTEAWIQTALKKLPAADVRPVVRGRWTDHRTIEHDGEWYCTACGKEITIYMGADREDRYNFCPNCGADMKEES